MYLREVGQKYRNIFVRFLVQMKTSKSHSEINRPLGLCNAMNRDSIHPVYSDCNVETTGFFAGILSKGFIKV